MLGVVDFLRQTSRTSPILVMIADELIAACWYIGSSDEVLQWSEGKVTSTVLITRDATRCE